MPSAEESTMSILADHRVSVFLMPTVRQSLDEERS
jgi:hypothetical protein